MGMNMKTWLIGWATDKVGFMEYHLRAMADEIGYTVPVSWFEKDVTLKPRKGLFRMRSGGYDHKSSVYRAASTSQH